MVPAFITLVVVVATLLILLLNVGCTGMFTNPRPQGDQAMGLIVPIFGLPIAILALTGAALLAMGRVSSTAMGTIASPPQLSGLLVVALTFGVALAAGMAFMLWCEPGAVSKSLKPVTAPFGILAGVCGPVLLAVMLLVGVWMSKSSAAAALAPGQASGLALRAGFVAVCLLALTGYALAGSMAWKGLSHRAASRAAVRASTLEREARWEAHRKKSPKQRITDDFAEFSPTNPLWTIVVYLLEQPGQPLDDNGRRVVVDRALKTPDFDAQLESCLKSKYHIYRTAAAEFLVHVPETELAPRRDAWGHFLLGSIAATNNEMASYPAWLAEARDSKPQPIDNVRVLLKAADRFTTWADYAKLRERFQKMADDSSALNADAAREKLITTLAAAGYRAATPRHAGR